MDHPLRPGFEGALLLDAPGEPFLVALEDRIRQGLLSGRRAEWDRFDVTSRTGESLVLRSRGLLTAVRSGLNCLAVDVQEGEGGLVANYRAGFLLWTLYRVALCLCLAGGLAALRFLWAPWQIGMVTASIPASEFLFWGVLAVLGLAWPWVLVMLHRPRMRERLEDLLGSVAEGAKEKATGRDRSP